MFGKPFINGLLISMLLLSGANTWGQSSGSITPISSFSNTQQSTSSTTLQNSDVVITAANLENGKDYLILYSASYGSNNTSNVPQVNITYGSTIIATGSDEGSSSGTPEALRIASLHGNYILTGDGSSDLRIRYRTITGGTAYISGKSLLAIPLEGLIENEDYWFVGQNGDAAEVSTTSAYVDLLTNTINLPENGDYLVLNSAEGWTPSGSSSNGEQFRVTINGSVQKSAMAKEWEDNRASRSFSYARVHNLNSGNNSFKIEVGSRQGSASKSFRRGRILVVKASSFDQMSYVSSDADVSTLAQHPAYDNYLNYTYTPNQQEHVVVIGNVWANQGQTYRSVVMRLANKTDDTYFSDFISDDAKDKNIDRTMLSVFGTEEIAVPKTYALHISGESSYSTANHFQYGDLIVWSMTLAAGPINQPPVVSDIPDQSVAEGASFTTISLDDYVTDSDNLDSEISWSYSGNTELTVSIDVNRVATITIPSLEWNGSETITFTATDPGLLTDSDPATFTVTAVNDAPIVSDIPDQTVSEGGSFTTINLDDYVSDIDNLDTDINWSYAGNTELTVSIDINRIATITIPDINWNGSETITFTATDPGLLSDSDPATFTVMAVNDAPVVADIPDQTVSEGGSFSTINLDDYVADVDNLDSEINWSYTGNTALVVSIDVNRVATITIPGTEWNGSETITFTATDPGLLNDSDPATFAVTAVNDAPAVSDIPDQMVVEGSTFTTINLDGYVIDIDNLDSDISWTYAGNSELIVSIDLNRVATITIPDIDWNGSETITFTATDPGLLFSSDPATFAVTAVNDAPVVSDIPDQTIPEGVSFTTISLDDFVADVDNLDSDISWTYAGNSELTVSIDVNRVATITIPGSEWNGSETITFIATDPDLLADSDPATLTVTAINDAPIVSDIPDQTVPEGGSFTTISLDDYVADVDNLDSDIIWSYSGSSELTVLIDVNRVATITIPSSEWNGSETITFTATDPGFLSDSDPATFTVTTINDAPVVSDIPDQSISEGGSFATINLDDYVSDIDNPDSDISWTYAGNAELTVSIDVNRIATIIIPDVDWYGSETLTFTATDPGFLSDSDPATFTVTATNDAPVVSDIPNQSVAEGFTFVTVNLDDYVVDVDNLDSDISWSYAGNTELGVSIDLNRVATITIPSAEWNGLEMITFTATDPGFLSDSDPAAFEVTAINDAPVVSNIPNQTIIEGSTFATINLDDYVSDVDNADAEITWSFNGNTDLTIDITARVATIIIPNVNWNGSETITFTAADPGLLSDNDPAIFSVTAVNDAPVVSDIPNQTIDEGLTFATINLDDYVTDIDNLDSDISWSYTGSSELTVFIDVNRVATITIPNANWNGSETITFTATDPGLLSDSDPASYTVTAGNDTPVVSDIPDQIIIEGSTFATINLDDYVNDVDNTDAEMTWSYSGNTDLTIDITARVATISIPSVDWNGAETLTFTATDPGLLSDSDPATFTVTAVNDAPVVSDIPNQTIPEGSIFATINLDDYVSDVDNFDSDISWNYGGNTDLTIDITARIATIIIPNVDWNGSETITFTATDPGLLSDSDPSTFIVTAINDAPVVSGFPDQTIAEGSIFATIILDDYVSDIDDIDSDISWSYNGNTNLIVDITARIATITIPNVDWNGSETITFTGTDPGLLSDSDSAIFTVTAINDAPVVSDIPDQTITEGATFTTINLDDYISDIDNADSDINWTSTGNIALTVTIDLNRVATVTIPSADWNGSETITFTATDPGLLSDSDPATFTVTAVNDAPVVSDIPDQLIAEGASFVTINLNDYVADVDDPDGNISWTYAGNAALTVDITASLATISIPNTEWNGSETITFTATDPGLLTDSDPATFTVTAVNDAPIVSDIPDQTIPEGSIFATINLDDYATDIDDLDSDISWGYSGNTELTVSIDINRVATITIPSTDWDGSEIITFTATDPGLLFDSDPATFTVTAVNDAPAVSDIPDQTISEGSTFTTINLDDYVNDVDNLDSDISWGYSGNTELTVSIDINRVATITIPSSDWNGSETITFTASDPDLLTDSDPATFTVSAVNDAPVVSDIPDQTIAEGSSFTTINLDDYVSDIDNIDAEMTWSFSGNTDLTIDIIAHVATIIIPDSNWNGSEAITFTATDPGLLSGNDPATFSVTAVNDAPVVSDIPDQTISEGSTFTTINLDDYAMDVDNLDSDINWAYTGNTALIVSIDINRVATITIPDIEWNGSETITFTATDPGLLSGSDPATFTVTAINDAPVVSGIPDQTIAEGSTFATINLDDYVSDVDNTDLEMNWSYSGNTDLIVDITARIATISIPDIEWNGSETITFTANDPGLLSGSDAATFTVTAINDAPVVSDIPDQTIAEGASFVTITLDDYVVDIDDLDSDISWGYAGNAALTVSIDANRVAMITIPDIDWSGSETITFTATDSGLLTDSDPAIFTVTAVNDAPIVSDIPDQTVDEGASFVTIILDDYVSDIDNIDSEMIWNYGGNTDLTVDITAYIATITIPTSDWNGSETITFTATDPGLLSDSDPATFTVTAVNDAPVVSDIPNQTIDEGLTFATVNLDDYVSDIDNLDADISWVYAGNTALAVSIDINRVATITIPNIDWSGSETITFTATDLGLLSDSDPATLTVTAINDAPVISSIPDQTILEGGSFNTITLDDFVSDVDNADAEMLWSYSGNIDLMVDITARVATISVPSSIWNGLETITFKVTDPGLLFDEDLVVFTVTAVNNSPVLDPIGDQTVAEDDNLNLTVAASDVDGTTPVLSSSTLPTNAAFVDHGTGSGTFDFNPDFDQAGTIMITFYADDGLETDSETITISVTNTNRPPQLDPIGDQTVAEGDNLNVTITASDPDGDIPILTTSTLPPNASLFDNGGGNWTFDFNPDFSQAGIYVVTFSASDGLATDFEDVTITVTGGNSPPVLSPIGNQDVIEGDYLSFLVTASDLDGDSPAITSTQLPDGASFVDYGDGSALFEWTPSFVQSELYEVTFYATDDSLSTDSELIVITVHEAGNQLPVLAPIGPHSTIEGMRLTFEVTATDAESIPSLSASSLPANASFMDNGSGNGWFDWTPDSTQSGTHIITFYAIDDSSASTFEDVTIIVDDDALIPTIILVSPDDGITTPNQNMDLSATITDDGPLTVWIYGGRTPDASHLLYTEAGFSMPDLSYLWDAPVFDIDPLNSMGLWHFDENNEESVFDASENALEGQFVGDPLWVKGKFGYALDFDGINDYITVDDDPNLDIDSATGAVTMEAWVYPHSTGQNHWRAIVAKRGIGTGTGPCNYQMMIDGDTGNLTYYSSSSSIVWGVDHVSSIYIPENQWSYVAITLDAVEGRARFYINGVVGDSIDGVVLGRAHNDELTIGTASRNIECFDGLIDEVRISRRTMSPEEIAANYSHIGGGNHYWRVEAEDGIGRHVVSETRSFTVEDNESPVIIAHNPLSGALISDTLVELQVSSWDESRSTVRVFGDTLPNPTELLFEVADVTGTYIRHLWTGLGEKTYYWRAEAEDAFGQSSSTEIREMIVKLYICGDANGDARVNVGDAVFLINYVFQDGIAPDPVCSGNCNGDGATNVGDAVYLINLVFKGGPPPVVPCCP